MPSKQYKILNLKLNTILQFLNDSSAFTTSSMVREDVEFLLKGQEMEMKNLFDKAISQLETRLSANMSSFTYDIIKIKNMAHERHESFENMVTDSKESIELKIKDFVDLVSKDIMKLDKFGIGIQQNVDVLLGATRTLIEDIRAFNKHYVEEWKLMKELDGKVFTNIDNALTSFHDRLPKFDIPSMTSISQEQISSMVSSMESCFKTQLAPILVLVLRLPTNVPRPSMLVSQGGDKDGSSKDEGDDEGKFVGMVISMQIPFSIQMNLF
ncbi:unnamed protein product [Lactuca saligna]|nr:unnamed protein product [Lactuca saligna]